VPEPRSVFRLVALAAFILVVALALWLLEAEWPVVVGVMAGAWILAAAFEWAAWRQERPERPAPLLSAPPPLEPVAPPPPEPAIAQAPPEPEAGPPLGPVAASPPRAEPVPPVPIPSEPVSDEEDETPTDPGPSGEEVPVEPEPVAEEQPQEPEEEPPPPIPPPRPTTPPATERPPLRPVPTRPPTPTPSPPPAPPPAARRAGQPAGVVDLRTRATAQPRQWNLWDLERLARQHLQQEDRDRFEALSYLFVHLRQFATPDGSLPVEFDALVRESFGDLLEQRR
jgi:hypothetical protein